MKNFKHSLMESNFSTEDIKKVIKHLKTKNVIRETSRNILPKFLIDKPKMGFAPLENKLVNSDEIKSLLLGHTL